MRLSPQVNDFDTYLIAATSLYLAGKVEEEHRKIRDIVNVCYRTLHKSKSPLDIGETFYGLRDAVANCELYILRVLRFKVAFDHPHKYLLHYLKALHDWFQPYCQLSIWGFNAMVLRYHTIDLHIPNGGQYFQKT
ncbi:unnamed protein product [Acanthosepion pharaonis]|uniref:Cyclin N-terminal domain-containing protein n=1 Tax=Acanthosepion pharaonis TaxID=158019 RepID=A0A812CHV6_ACAPH|nr:unnamed protein product [Sepia pharaonis]